jgi:hypothetical protein
MDVMRDCISTPKMARKHQESVEDTTCCHFVFAGTKMRDF